MSNRRSTAASRACLPLLLLLSMRCALAQFPERPIELVIPFDAGGGADIEGRVLAEEMSELLGVPVVPVNKPGAGGAVAYTYVKNAAPDGYTIAWNSSSILTMTNLGNVDFAYDAMDHIGRVEFQPMIFAVGASSRWSDFESFAGDCAAAPSALRVSNSGTGSATHLGALALMSVAGCEVVHLPVGTRRRNATVLSGEADAMVAPLTEAISLARAGRLRLLATLSAERNAVIPDVPTATELGFDAQLDLFRGLSVPKGTPAQVTARLVDAMTQAAGSAAFTKLAREVGFTVDPLPAEAFETLLRVEDAKVRAVIRDAGLSGSPASGD